MSQQHPGGAQNSDPYGQQNSYDPYQAPAPGTGSDSTGFEPSSSDPYAAPSYGSSTGYGSGASYGTDSSYEGAPSFGSEPSYGSGPQYAAAAGAPGQPPYGTGGPVPGKGMRTSGVVLLGVGGFILVLTVAIGLIMAFVNGANTRDQFEGTNRTFTTSITVNVKKDQKFSVYADRYASYYSRPSTGSGSTYRPSTSYGSTAACRVTDGSGTALRLTRYASSSRDVDGRSMRATGYYTATSDGAVSITCPQYTASTARYAVATPVDAGAVAGLVLGIILAVAGGIFGLLITGLGLLFFFLGRSRMRKGPAQQPTNYSGPGGWQPAV